MGFPSLLRWATHTTTPANLDHEKQTWGGPLGRGGGRARSHTPSSDVPLTYPRRLVLHVRDVSPPPKHEYESPVPTSNTPDALATGQRQAYGMTLAGVDFFALQCNNPDPTPFPSACQGAVPASQKPVRRLVMSCLSVCLAVWLSIGLAPEASSGPLSKPYPCSHSPAGRSCPSFSRFFMLSTPEVYDV
ncbi:hypothetical protein LZ30DRAFT_687928 [Colletotrichum cereale]|nr:hypothetical protein LZ30DRAFT_687928 [Colletotrichum cereale]